MPTFKIQRHSSPRFEPAAGAAIQALLYHWMARNMETSCKEQNYKRNYFSDKINTDTWAKKRISLSHLSTAFALHSRDGGLHSPASNA